MSMKKSLLKKALPMIGIVVVIIAIVVGLGIYIKTTKENELTDIERISKMLTTTRKTDIYIVGEDIDFDNAVTATIIDEVTMSNISGSGEYKVIIVNDLNNEVELSEDEIELIRDLIGKDNYMLIYLGEKYSATWNDTSYGIADVEGNLCFIYYSWDGVPTRNVGAWNVKDQETSKGALGQVILYSIEDYLQ